MVEILCICHRQQRPFLLNNHELPKPKACDEGIFPGLKQLTISIQQPNIFEIIKAYNAIYKTAALMACLGMRTEVKMIMRLRFKCP